jgi:dolichol-phosphate mannosyltransferase
VDLRDAAAVGRAVREARPERIFHLAAYGAYSSQTDPLRMVHTHVAGTVNLVEACLRVGFGAFVHAGSSSEYGFKDHAPAEDEALDPNSCYAVTKAAATHYCRYVARREGASIATLRLYSVYGPWEEPTRFIPTLILRGMEGTLPPLVDPEIARDYVHVEDVVEAFLLAAETLSAEPGAVYNVGTGVQTTIREAVEVARGVFGIADPPRWGSMANRIWDTGTWLADARRIRATLGWTPRYAFEDGFRATADWFTANPAIAEEYRRRAATAP